VNPHRIYKIAKTLVKSQLRSGRAGSRGNRFFSNPKITLFEDAILFAAAAGLVYGILGLIGSMSEEMASVLSTMTLQAVTSLPALLPPFIFVAAVLFELNVSSKFASSDVINWLPVSQTDYVSASVLSVSYSYSFVVALGLGVTFPLAARAGLLLAWIVSAALSLVGLFATGALIEIMRAALNRVTSATYGRARRGTIVIRIVVVVLVIVIFDLGFNPLVLSNLVSTFSGVVSSAYFVPFFWSSIAISEVVAGKLLLSVLFSGLTVFFAFILLLAAVKVRARYWSPLPVTIEVTESEYSPRAGFLQSLGLSSVQAAIVRKDMKGFTRRREMIAYLALPVVFIAVTLVPQISSGGGAPPIISFWFLGGIATIMVAAISVGQEGKAILNIYASPVTARAFLMAKLFVAALFGMGTMLTMLAVSSVLMPPAATGFLASLLVSIVIVAECVFIGLGIATRFPDLQDRPRPRFVQPMWLLLAILLGIVLAFITASPLIIWQFMSAYLEGIGLSYGIAVGLGLAFGFGVSVIAYLWAKSGATKLMSELIV
jgi:hypothetical protein